MVSTGAYILSAGSNARELLQIPLIPGDVVDVPQDQLPQDQLSEGVELLSTLDSGDTAWMLTSTILVLMMTIPGLALFYGGLVRPKNVLNAASNVFATVALVTLVWVLWGYSIAFSDVEMEKGRYNLHSFFGSLHNGGLTGISLFSSTGNYPASIFVTFHCMFACITTAIISGAFAERLRLTAVWAFAILWSTAVYCPLAHQVWGGDGADADGGHRADRTRRRGDPDEPGDGSRNHAQRRRPAVTRHLHRGPPDDAGGASDLSHQHGLSRDEISGG